MHRKTCVAGIAGLVLGASMAAGLDMNGYLPAKGEGTVAISYRTRSSWGS